MAVAKNHARIIVPKRVRWPDRAPKADRIPSLHGYPYHRLVVADGLGGPCHFARISSALPVQLAVGAVRVPGCRLKRVDDPRTASHPTGSAPVAIERLRGHVRDFHRG